MKGREVEGDGEGSRGKDEGSRGKGREAGVGGIN